MTHLSSSWSGTRFRPKLYFVSFHFSFSQPKKGSNGNGKFNRFLIRLDFELEAEWKKVKMESVFDSSNGWTMSHATPTSPF